MFKKIGIIFCSLFLLATPVHSEVAPPDKEVRFMWDMDYYGKHELTDLARKLSRNIGYPDMPVNLSNLAA